MRVLFYSPYAKWHYHTVQEITLAHALAERGAEPRFVTCDGQLPACDVFRANVNARHDRSCLDCQQASSSTFAGMGMTYEWLGSFVPRAARLAAKDWVEALPREALLSARWHGHPVGDWARSSAFYQFRMSRFDLAEPRVERCLRDHIHGAVLAAEALEALYEEWQPDLVVMLNGRFFSHQAAFSLARERGIRVVTHERGLLKGTLRLAEDARIHDLGLYRELWERCRELPLDDAELAWTRAVFADRRLGTNLPGEKFSPPPQQQEALRRQLDLGDAPVLALFSSSDDESASFDDRRSGAFPDSLDWLDAGAELARAFPDHRLVIRLHPNLSRHGGNQQALAHAQTLRAALPPNARMVMPDDDVSSYTLADIAQVGLVYFSTIGLEMALRGQPVVAVAQGWYGHTDFVRLVRRPEDYAGAVRAAAGQGPQLEVARSAWRFAHATYRAMSIPFPLVIEKPRHFGKPQYHDTALLRPGVEPNLDRICRVLLGEEPLLEAPSAEQRARSREAEDRFFAEWLSTAAGSAALAPPSIPSPAQASP